MESFIWPLKKTIKTILSGKFNKQWSANKKKLHAGIDITASAGDLVFATANGKVVKAGNCGRYCFVFDWKKDIVVAHDLGDYCTSYLHINPKVEVGTTVKAGEIIGTVARLAYNSHLHFSVWKGAFDSVLTPRGALPLPEYVGKIEPKTDPVFPSNFIDPESFEYTYK